MELSPKEIWKDVDGFEGLYQISNYGRLKSFHKRKHGELRSVKNSKGFYLTIPLSKNRKTYTKRIHRLVAEAYIANPYNKRIVHHIDGNKQNNNVVNLTWVTPTEHVLIEIRNNPNIISGINNYNKYIKPKTLIQLSLDNEYIAEYPNAIEAYKSTGICSRNILQVASHDEFKPGHTRKQAGGYKWIFKQERRIAV